MLRELLEVVKKLFEVTDSLEQAKDEKRQKIEKFFYKIEQCFRDSAEVLNYELIPRTQVEELKIYAEELPKILDDVYEKKKINELSNLLKNAANKIGANDPPEDYSEDIETAAGMFKGLAVIVATQTELDRQNQKKKNNSKSFFSLPINRRNFRQEQWVLDWLASICKCQMLGGKWLTFGTGILTNLSFSKLQKLFANGLSKLHVVALKLSYIIKIY